MITTPARDRHALRVVVTIILIVAAIPVAGGVWLWWNLFRPLPHDADLRSRFTNQREAFEALAAQARADASLVGAGHDWMLMRFDVFVRDTPRFNRLLTASEVRSSGRSGLQGLLDRTGARSLSRSPAGDAVWFIVGSNLEGRKGIVYSEGARQPVRSSLDDLSRSGSLQGRQGYVMLAPRWFLFIMPRD